MTTEVNYYRGGICQQNQKHCTNCCSHQQKSDGECTYSQGCDTDTQLTYEQRECYCSTCPPGERVRYNPTEQDYINSEYNEYKYFCPSGEVSLRWKSGCERRITDRRTRRNAVTTKQTYEGPMCGFVRRRFDAMSNEWTVDWGEGVCNAPMPFVCDMNGQSRGNAWIEAFDHCQPNNPVLNPMKRTAPTPSGGSHEAAVSLLGIVCAATAVLG